MAEPYKEKLNSFGSTVEFWPLGEVSGNAVGAKGAVSGTASAEGLTRAQASLLPNGEGKSCLFDGAKGLFTLEDLAALDTGDSISVGAWIKYSVEGTFKAIYSGPGTGPILYLGTTNKVIFDKKGSTNLITTTPTVPVNTVTHVMVVKSGAERKAYINGVEVAITGSAATLENPAGVYTLGRDAAGGSFFAGYLQYISLSNAALNATQIFELYSAGSASLGTTDLFIKSGFLRNNKGALVTGAIGTVWDTGFLREKVAGKLKVTESTVGATWKSGFLRNVEGALIVKEAGAEGVAWKSGHLRDKNGALVVIKSEAETPITWWGGFLRDKSGRLIIE